MKRTNNRKRAAWLAGMILWGLSGSSWAGPLHDAAAVSNNAEKIQQLIDSDGEDVDGVDENGDTALHIASRKGFLKNVEALGNRGANPRVINQKSSLKRTPLREALANDQLEVFKYLVTEILGDGDAQVGLVKPDGTGKTPAHDAMWEGTEEIVRWVLKELGNQGLTQLIDKAQRTLLHFAARNKKGPESITLVLKSESELLNMQDRFKMTALDWTVKSGINNIDAARQNQESLFAKESRWNQGKSFFFLLQQGADFGKGKNTKQLTITKKTKQESLRYIADEFKSFRESRNTNLVNGYLRHKIEEKSFPNGLKKVIQKYIDDSELQAKVDMLRPNP